MSMMDWIVIVGGVASIAWIDWYFFPSPRRAAGAVNGEGRRKEARPSKPKTGLRL
jgi:hypothetical protein